MFEQAIRNKWRWQYRGQLSVEDLWDLNLSQLDEIYKALRRERKVTGEKSLLDNESTESDELKAKITIVEYIFNTKVTERDAQKALAEKAAQKQRVLEIIAKKQDEGLQNLSLEELQAML